MNKPMSYSWHKHDLYTLPEEFSVNYWRFDHDDLHFGSREDILIARRGWPLADLTHLVRMFGRVIFQAIMTSSGLHIVI